MMEIPQASRYATDDRTSARMSRVRPVDTRPELIVRRALWTLGYRYRLHQYDLPGRPDVVLRSRRAAIYVHGCFWHRHPGCTRATTPKRNAQLWEEKFHHTVVRDRDSLQALREAGWKTLVLWECQIQEPTSLTRTLKEFLENQP